MNDVPWSNVVALMGFFACAVGIAWAAAWAMRGRDK